MDLLPLVLHLGILAVAVVLHEVGHGVVAYGCGDRTAAEQGRLTLNPLRHVDPVGTLLVPGFLLISAWMVGAKPFLFGWAKPVPVDPRRMRRPRRDMALVALAGPMTNFLLAGVAIFGLRASLDVDGVVGTMTQVTARMAVITNVVLGVFNLLPILPLDGGRFLTSLLPYSVARQYVRLEPVGLIVVVLLVSQTSILAILAQPVLDAFVWLASRGE